MTLGVFNKYELDMVWGIYTRYFSPTLPRVHADGLKRGK